MTLKPLLLGILGVAVFTAGSYFILSPYVEKMASRSEIEDADIETITDVYESESLSEVPDEDTIELTDSELNDDGTEAVVTTFPQQPEPEPEPAKVVTPTTPAPTTVVTPEPRVPAVSTPSGYTLSAIATHNSKASCWTAVGDSVYDITAYVPKHPGGEKDILKICGKDGTSAFEGEHEGESRPENILAKYRIGALI